MPDPGNLPPDCQLIRSKRLGMVPAMSMRRAARLAGMPEATWRQAENGTRARTYDVLARQALTVDATPWELEQVNRHDAAVHLRALMRDKLDDAAGVPGPLRELAVSAARAGLDEPLTEILQGLADIDRSDGLTVRQKAALRDELLAGIVRDIGERRANVRAVLRVAHDAR